MSRHRVSCSGECFPWPTGETQIVATEPLCLTSVLNVKSYAFEVTRHWHVFEAVDFSKKVAYLTFSNRPEHNEGCLAEINTVVHNYTISTVYNVLANDLK